MILVAASVAGKKAVATAPALALPMLAALMPADIFSTVALSLGPHVMAAIGGAIGSAVRFHVLRLRWRGYWKEGLAAAALGGVFGQANLPVVTDMLSKVSPEMFPVAQGTAIGILMAAGTGFLTDFIDAYRAKMGGGK